MRHYFYIILLTYSLLFPTLVMGKECDPFILTTMPKTGTYLLTPFLEKLTGQKQLWAADYLQTVCPVYDYEVWYCYKNDPDWVPVYLHHELVPTATYAYVHDYIWEHGRFFACHTPFSEPLDALLTSKGIKAFHIVRDPRDYCVSGTFFYAKGDCMFSKEWFQSLPFDEQLMVMIRGETWYNGTRWFLEVFDGWHNSPNCCILSFERLLGLSKGVYDQEEQTKELRKIAAHINCEACDEELLNCFRESYGQGPTFRDAKIRKWADYFTAEHAQAAKEEFGDFLIKYGYEDSDNWGDN